MRTRTMVVGAVTALLVSACGNAAETVAEKVIENETGADVTITDDGASMQVTDEDGSTVDFNSTDGTVVITGTDDEGNESTIEMGGTEVPADFPMPIPDGSEVTFVSTFDTPEGASTSVTVQIDPSDTASVLEMYKTWFADQGMEVTSAEGMVIGGSETVASLVQIADYGTYAEVILTWSPTG
ncbi:MAG: hypothetical protein JJE47_02220 [Acidimicrobiia bacterium]|nr:hypothetical protein [Acidimicrobiia bacterium]